MITTASDSFSDDVHGDFQKKINNLKNKSLHELRADIEEGKASRRRNHQLPLEIFRSETDKEYNFIVVGGGTAGSVIASQLSEIPSWRFLLIEVGGDEPIAAQVPSMALNFIGSDIDWLYKMEPEKAACLSSNEKRCSLPRGSLRTILVRKEVIVSGETVKSPQILLLSGIGPKEENVR